MQECKGAKLQSHIPAQVNMGYIFRKKMGPLHPRFKEKKLYFSRTISKNGHLFLPKWPLTVVTSPGGTRLWLGRRCAARTSGPLPMFRVKTVPMFRDFTPKMDPCLGILLQKQAIFKKIFRIFFKNGPTFRDFGAKNGTHV